MKTFAVEERRLRQLDPRHSVWRALTTTQACITGCAAQAPIELWLCRFINVVHTQIPVQVRGGP